MQNAETKKTLKTLKRTLSESDTDDEKSNQGEIDTDEEKDFDDFSDEEKNSTDQKRVKTSYDLPPSTPRLRRIDPRAESDMEILNLNFANLRTQSEQPGAALTRRSSSSSVHSSNAHRLDSSPRSPILK